jgi:hypothetical protein
MTFDRRILALTIYAIAWSGCETRAPQAARVVRAAPYITWIIMSGDRDDPDREFICQSDPRTECVISASRPNQPVFSDVHLYYHAEGVETKYAGSVQIGFFESPAGSRNVAIDFTVKKEQSIISQSVTNVVTSKPGTFAMTFDVSRTLTETGTSQAIHDEVNVVVKELTR